MKVFGRTWTNDEIGQLYEDAMTLDGIAIKLMIRRRMWFSCELCKKRYRHWLCDDKAWKNLPRVLHGKTLCQSCFCVIRAYQRMERKRRRTNDK